MRLYANFAHVAYRKNTHTAAGYGIQQHGKIIGWKDLKQDKQIFVFE